MTSLKTNVKDLIPGGSWVLVFKTSIFFLPEDGTLLSKNFGDTPLICVLIKAVHFFG